MLKNFSDILEYHDFLKNNYDNLSISSKKRLSNIVYKRALHKLKKLDIKLASECIKQSYSLIGRPARDPSILIRSFILMQHLGYKSIHKWCNELNDDELLLYLIGSSNKLCVSNHYDFIERFTCKVHSNKELHNKDYYKKEPKDKPKRNEKLVNYSTRETILLFDKYKDGAKCDVDRVMYRLQSIFNSLVVVPSTNKGLIDKDELILSGDGSSLHIRASKFPSKVKEGNEDEDIYHYSAPDADIGWDSNLECFYLGYTYYNISTYNKKHKIDLPVFISLEKASKHDALTSFSAFAQLLDLNEDLHPKYVCLDSASDANPIYQYFHHNNITPIIDHNKRNESKVKLNNDGDEYINEQGIPVCMNNNTMSFFGYDKQRRRKKYRCPLAMGKIKECPFKDKCSKSDYGRVIYIVDGENYRYNGPVPYKSDTWKQIYKNRTCTERINNRTLHDYNLEYQGIRDYGKNAFFSIMAGINIHLDAWIKIEASSN